MVDRDHVHPEDLPGYALGYEQGIFDERRKVIAELTRDEVYRMLRAVALDMANATLLTAPGSSHGTVVDVALSAAWEKLKDRAHLLAPEEEGDGSRFDEPSRDDRGYDKGTATRNDKVLSGDQPRKNIAHNSPASPSSEPARAGDVEREPALEALREQVAATRPRVLEAIRGNPVSWSVEQLTRSPRIDAGSTVVALAVYDLIERGELVLDERLRVSLPPVAHEEGSTHG